MATSVASVVSHFPDAENGFTTTTAGSVASAATTVTLNSVGGYTNGMPVVLVIDPTDTTKKQTFTGIVDTAGVQITSVVWTAGTNQTHDLGATVVDYATATHIAMISKGLLVSLNQDGTHKADSITPSMWTNPYCFRAYDSGGTSIVDGVYTKIALATEVYDYNNDFTTGTYTVPITGVYHFDGMATIGAIASGVLMLVAVYIDGVIDTRGKQEVPTSGCSTTVSCDISLTAGQNVKLYCYQDTAGDEALSAGASQTWFSGHLVSPQ